MPIDYADPDAGTFTLYLARHPRRGDRVGSLLVNPGGPGCRRHRSRRVADQIYGQALLDAFDIVGWDPAGDRAAATPASTASTTTTGYFAGTD